jgi:hypothetical protein
MEGSFGTSFGDVRVHQDGLAEQRGALAVTAGHDIHFAGGAYAPSTPGGQQLIGHELTHVVQQERGGGAVAQRKPEGAASAPTLAAAELEAEADRVGAAAASGQRVEVAGMAAGHVAQNFGGKEHRHIGDHATRRKGQRTYIPLGSKGYKLSYGEMVALAGDYFGSLAQMERLANNPGKGPDTSEALDYARYVKLGYRETYMDDSVDEDMENDDIKEAAATDHRYEASHYSKETRRVVDEQYYKLAANNEPHFVTPRAEDAKRAGPDRVFSAGQTYRENHEIAIERAVLAGAAGEPVDQALTAEAFGDHFLTDACSAGHLRTPREDVETWWNARDPGIAEKLKSYIAWRTTDWIRKNWDSLGSNFPTIILQKVTEGIENAMGSMPPLTMGVLVGIALHDYDNFKGLHVLVGGDKKTIYGDDSLDKGDTMSVAVNAVRAGANEVVHAHALGRQRQSPEVAKASLKTKGYYAAERLLPQLDPSFSAQQPMPKWMVGNLEQLLADGPMTEALRVMVRVKLDELRKIANAQKYPGNKGMIEGFIVPAWVDPIGTLRAIWSYQDQGQAQIYDSMPGAGIPPL